MGRSAGGAQSALRASSPRVLHGLVSKPTLQSGIAISPPLEAPRLLRLAALAAHGRLGGSPWTTTRATTAAFAAM